MNFKTGKNKEWGVWNNLNDYFKEKRIDQLHKATLSISNQTFAIKKMCVFILTATLGIMQNFRKENNCSDYSGIILCGTIIMLFYLADSVAYYYQSKLRNLMRKIELEIKENNNAYCKDCGQCRENIKLGSKVFPKIVLLKKSAVNGSHFFYVVLFLICIVFFYLLPF
ncbi:hypothetical protein [Akkermansia muciniphila]|uniref:hypothetical protein n=1 Tax=Akkermansia muciniphila TaxID=239935 RepID=UPI0011AF04D4|nr:hypothetical protein [Akkermansia muciniphila]